MLWLKALHLIFVVTWFAGLFYLPRLFIYHAAATDAPGRERFIVMERRLFAIMTIGAMLALSFGVSMLIVTPQLLDARWLQLKLILVLFLVVYHFWCHRLMVDLRGGRGVHTSRWYRWFNEVPGLFLIAVVLLAVLKPF